MNTGIKTLVSVGGVIWFSAFSTKAWGALDLGFTQTFLGTPASISSTETRGLTDFSAKYEFHSESFVLEGGLDLGLQKSVVISPRLREVYGSFGLESRGFRFSFGRKLSRFSETDSRWGLGLWQPRYRIDYMVMAATPYEMTDGLVGTFVQYRSRKFFTQVSFQPVFLPDQGPSFDLSSGDCRTRSVWFQCPKSEQVLFSKPTRIEYEVKMPSIPSVLFSNPGASWVGEYREGRGFWLRSAYAYMPISQPIVAIDAFQDPRTPEKAQVHLIPRFNYHHLLGLDLGFEKEKFGVWTGASAEIPNSEDDLGILTTERLRRALLLSGGMQWRPLGRTELSFDFLRVFGGLSEISGNLVPDQGSPFEERYSFREAIKLGAKEIPIPGISAEKLRARASWQRDFYFSTQWISAGLDWSVSPSLIFSLGVDVLASDSNAKVPSSDWVTLYQANDRLRGGLRYVF